MQHFIQSTFLQSDGQLELELIIEWKSGIKNTECPDSNTELLNIMQTLFRLLLT